MKEEEGGMREAGNVTRMIQPTKRDIGKFTFYIYPLPAFTAANLSTEVVSLLSPLAGSIAGAFKTSGDSSSKDDSAEKKSLMDMDINEAAPYIAGAFSHLSADKVEKLIRALLLGGNVAVCEAESSDAEYLTEDKCNEVFRGNVQNMFVLAFYVLRENYGDFFVNIGSRSGDAIEAVKKMISPDMAPST